MKLKIVLFFTLLFISCSKPQDDTIYIEQTYDFNTEELELMHVTNVYRSSIQLDTLKSNQHIAYICSEHNDYMILNDTINHDYFHSRSENLVKTLHASRIGEVLAYNYTTPNSVLNAWVNSPNHKNIIEGKFTHFGVAIKEDSFGRKYYTFIFAKI